MNLIKLTSLKKARIILLINSLILFLFIIFTPYFVRVGVWSIPEWAIEGTFLAVEISVLIKLFRNYDRHSRRVEREVNKLDDKLKEQQKVLVDSLEYLGRMNVQMSIVKKVMNKLKFPADDNRLEYVLNEMVQTLITLSGQKSVFLKIVDLDGFKTVKEINLLTDKKKQKNIDEISNDKLCQQKKAYSYTKDNMLIVSSNYDNFSLKTFAIFPIKKQKKVDSEKIELIQGIVNQCEIVYLLFNSKYYKRKQ